MKRAGIWFSSFVLLLGMAFAFGITAYAEDAPPGTTGEGPPADAGVEQTAAQAGGAGGGDDIVPDAGAPDEGGVVDGNLATTTLPADEPVQAAEAQVAEATPETTPLSENQQQNSQPDALAATPPNGEYCDDGVWRYYENGTPATGWRQLEDGRSVFYDDNGAMQYGEQYVDGSWHYFDPVYGGLTLGEVHLPDGRWANYTETGRSEGFTQLADGRMVYYDPASGAMQYGEQNVGGNLHYFDPVYGGLTTGEVHLPDERWVNYTETGRSEGYTQLADGRMVYYDPASGAMQYGEQCIEGSPRYFDPIYGYLTLGEVHLPDGRTIYFNPENGNLMTGWLEINGAASYYDPANGAANGLTYIGGNAYYFENGTMLTGWASADDGTWMLFGDDGVFTGQTSTNMPENDSVAIGQAFAYYVNQMRANAGSYLPLVEMHKDLMAGAQQIADEILYVPINNSEVRSVLDEDRNPMPWYTVYIPMGYGGELGNGTYIKPPIGSYFTYGGESGKDTYVPRWQSHSVKSLLAYIEASFASSPSGNILLNPQYFQYGIGYWDDPNVAGENNRTWIIHWGIGDIDKA